MSFQSAVKFVFHFQIKSKCKWSAAISSYHKYITWTQWTWKTSWEVFWRGHYLRRAGVSLTKAFCSTGLLSYRLLGFTGTTARLVRAMKYLSLDDWLEIVRNVSHLLSVESMFSTNCISAELLWGQGKETGRNRLLPPHGHLRYYSQK